MVIGMGASILIARRGQGVAPFIFINKCWCPTANLEVPPCIPFFVRVNKLTGSSVKNPERRAIFNISLNENWETQVCSLEMMRLEVQSTWDETDWGVSFFSILSFLNEKWETEIWVHEKVKRELHSPWTATFYIHIERIFFYKCQRYVLLHFGVI